MDTTPASSPLQSATVRDRHAGGTTLVPPPAVLEADYVDREEHAVQAGATGDTEDAQSQIQLAIVEKSAGHVPQQVTTQPWAGPCLWPAAAAGWDASHAMLNPLGSLAGNVGALFRAGRASHVAEARDAEVGRTARVSAVNTGGRLLLRWLELENFKSFQGKHIIGPLSNCIAIGGPNGAGKSNLIEAVAFALGVNARQLRCARLLDLLNVSRSSELAADGTAAAEEERTGTASALGGHSAGMRRGSTTVALHFVSAGAARGRVCASSAPFSEGSELLRPTRSFRRSLTEAGIDSYFIDEDAVTPEAYRDCLQRDCSCSLYTLQAMVVLQGQIDAVAGKTPRELARLIEEISGSAIYAERYEAAQAAMRKAREEAQRLFCRSSQLLQELKVLRKQKAEADNYLRHKQQQRHLQEELYLFRLFVAERIQAAERDQQQQAEQHQLKHREQLEQLLLEAQNADRGRITKELELQQVNEKLAKLARHSHELRGSCMAMLERARFREQQREELQRQQAKVTAQREELLEYEQQLLQQSVRTAERMREAEARVEAAEQRCVCAQQQQDSLLRQRLTPEQQALLQRLEISWQEQHALQQERIAARQLQLKALRNSLDLLQEEERELVRSESTAQELYTATAAKADAVGQGLQQVLSQAQSVKQGLDQLRSLVATGEEQRHSLELLQEELQHQLAQERNLVLDVRRVAHEREVCEQLKRHVSHTGVHAAAIECCQPLNKRLTVAVAAALGERATSIIVDSHELASRCIDYLKTMRLGSREFLPLETLRIRNGGIRRAAAAPGALEQRWQEDFLADEEDEGEGGGAHTLPPPAMDELPPSCRWAVDCVIFEDKLRPAFEFLLSDCVIVPTLAVAQQLRYGHSDFSATRAADAAAPRTRGLQQYRMVTLDGEKLLRSGVIAYEAGGLVARLAARWESQQQERVAARLRNVQEQLEALEVAETTNSEKLLQRTSEFAALHRQSVQLQAKARVWSEQAEEKQQALLRLRQQLHQQQQRVAALREDIRTKQLQIDEMQSHLQQLDQHHFAPLDRSVGRKHVRQEEQRSQQLLEKHRAEAASLAKQQQELQAELADCRDRLQQLQRKQERLLGGIEGERLQQEEQRLLQQLQVTEEEVAQADRQSESAAVEYKKTKDELKCHTETLQKIRERVEACQAEQRRLERVAAAAATRQQQAADEQQELLEHIVQQDIRLPLSVGSWRAVRAAVLGEAATVRDPAVAASGEAEHQRLQPTENMTSAAEDEAGEEGRERRPRSCSRFAVRRSSSGAPSSAEKASGEDPVAGRESDDCRMQVDSEASARGQQQQPDGDEGIRCELEQRFQLDFTRLPADKRELVSRSVQQGLTSVLEEEKEKYHQQLQQQAMLLRKLQPNLKADGQQQNLQQELNELEKQREVCRESAAAAEQELQQLQGCRSMLFLRCFHHCRAAVDFFFRELTAAGAADDSGSEGDEMETTRTGVSSSNANTTNTTAPATESAECAAERAEAAVPDETSSTSVAAAVQRRLVVADRSVPHSVQKRPVGKRSREGVRSGALAKVGGRAFLELEPLSSDSADAAAAVPNREDEAFLCGVSLLCMPPAKRIMPLQLLSGGERAAAAVSLLLALLSFLPRVPFLLLDEVDAALDSSRRKALARVLQAVAQQLQVLFVSLKDQMFATASMLVGVVVERPLGRSRCFLLDLLPYRKKRSGRSAACGRSARATAAITATVTGLAAPATPASARSSSHNVAADTDCVAPYYEASPPDGSKSSVTGFSSSSNRGGDSSLLSSRSSSTLGQSRSNFSRRSSSVVPCLKLGAPADEAEAIRRPPYPQKTRLLPQQW